MTSFWCSERNALLVGQAFAVLLPTVTMSAIIALAFRDGDFGLPAVLAAAIALAAGPGV